VIRFLDIIFSLLGLIVCAPLILFLILIGYFDSSSPIFLQERLGKNEKKFCLFKIRSMKVGSPATSSHLIDKDNITKFGSFIRYWKLDELLQLWNVIKGDMSLVGPRPCLPSQFLVIQERREKKVFRVRPGISGLSQLRNIDMSMPKQLALTDAELIDKMSLRLYLSILISTLFRKSI